MGSQKNSVRHRYSFIYLIRVNCYDREIWSESECSLPTAFVTSEIPKKLLELVFFVSDIFLLGHICDMRGRCEYVKLCPLLHCPHADHTSIIHKHTEQTPNIYSINCCPVNFLINYQFIECVQEHGSNETATADNTITMHIQIKYIYIGIYTYLYICSLVPPALVLLALSFVRGPICCLFVTHIA